MRNLRIANTCLHNLFFLLKNMAKGITIILKNCYRLEIVLSQDI